MTRKNFLFAFFSVIIFFCIIFITPSLTLAKIQKFDKFSVDVPSDWTVEQNDAELMLKSQSTDASVSISLNKTDGEELSDIAERLYLKFNGDDFEQDNDGDYSFNFTNVSGDDSVALITGNENYYLVFSITGFDDENAENDLQKILSTLDWDDIKNN